MFGRIDSVVLSTSSADVVQMAAVQQAPLASSGVIPIQDTKQARARVSEVVPWCLEAL